MLTQLQASPQEENVGPETINAQEDTIIEANENQFAVVCIKNEAGLHLSYNFRWGNGAWQAAQVGTGGNRWHSWKYPAGGNSSPAFEIRFDYDLRQGRNTSKTYTLSRNPAQFESCDYGKKYRFKRTGDFVDLYSVN